MKCKWCSLDVQIQLGFFTKESLRASPPEVGFRAVSDPKKYKSHKYK